MVLYRLQRRFDVPFRPQSGTLWFGNVCIKFNVRVELTVVELAVVELAVAELAVVELAVVANVRNLRTVPIYRRILLSVMLCFPVVIISG